MHDIDRFISDLKDRKTVSVPALQQQFDISYGDAHDLMDQLLRRGWVTRPERGVEYPVCRKKVRFRRMTDEEIDSAAKEVSGDCVNALRCLMRTGFSDFALMEKSVHGDDDTRQAIRELTKLGLIAKGCDEYYLLPDRGTVGRIITASRKNKRFSPFDD